MEGESSNKGILRDNVEVEDDKVHEEVKGKVVEPEPGMKFVDTDEIYEFYRNYGKCKGFAVTKYTRKKGDDGMVRWVTFVCDRYGKSRTVKSVASKQTGCKARITLCLDPDGSYRINSVILDHNHELSPSQSNYFRCNRERSAHGKRKLDKNDKEGTKVSKTCNSFGVEAGRHENITFLEKHCRNYSEKVSRLRLGDGDDIAIQNYFLKMQVQNTGFFFNMDLDEDGWLKNVFWADGRSREAYKEFGEVVTFDTSCLTNKYNIPLVYFVGANHHGQSTLLGCGLISCQDTQTFCWIFWTWLTCMSGCAPNGIISDQDNAIKKAIETVFPNTRHRWCLWHVMKKLPEKLGGYRQQDSISMDLQSVVYDSQNSTDFEHSWNAMIDQYGLQSDEWLSGLYKERHRWIPCYVKRSFWAGMSKTQRSESIDAFFDGYVNSKTTLKKFVDQYDIALRNKVEKESESDFKSFAQLVQCITLYEMEKQVQIAYTISKFKEFQKELTGQMYCFLTSIREDSMVSEYDLREDVVVGEGKRRVIFTVSFHKDECEVKCRCHMFEFRGILCRHAINVLISNDVMLIPEKYILHRWRKDVRRTHTRVIINYDGSSITSEQSRYDKMRSVFNRVADLAAEDEESYVGVMEWINNAMMKLSVKRLS